MLLEIVTLLIAIGYILNRFYFSGAKCLTHNRLDNKIVVITGANTGIGFNTALEIAKRGARVIMACRDITRAQKAADEIKAISGNPLVDVEYLDLADLDTVRTFAHQMNEKLDRIDILVNNAGLMQIPYWKTAQGFEMQLGVNHLGHFLLTNLLLDLMKKANSARIINVSSLTHARGRIKWDDINSQKSYTPFDAYCQSKLANVLFTVELAERLKGTSITTVSLHPGIVRTEILRYSYDSYIPLGYLAIIFFPIYRILSRSPTEGCQTTLHCALDDSVPKFNGCYFNDCRPVQMAKHAQDKGDARRLWDLSAKLVNL